MLQSTHYELKLVEGSDIVNPLVIDRPNYETIDGVMYENESKSVGSATELKSGTIHALTRSKGNQRFFCFTATSNYEAGDTFTVDSVPVTALLPNGTALPDGAYVINGTVLCSLIGTLLTVYTVGAAIADDSLRLGGQLPEYYATASDLTSVSNTASSAQTMAVNNSNAIIGINNKLSASHSGTTISELKTFLDTLSDRERISAAIKFNDAFMVRCVTLTATNTIYRVMYLAATYIAEYVYEHKTGASDDFYLYSYTYGATTRTQTGQTINSWTVYYIAD